LVRPELSDPAAILVDEPSRALRERVAIQHRHLRSVQHGEHASTDPL